MARLKYLVVLSAFSVTCGRPVMPPAPAPCEATRAPLEVISYNAGLAPGLVNYATPRVPHVVNALRAAEWDVMCLQEVWMDRDRDAIIGALGLRPENVLTADTRGKNENPADRCTAAEIDPMLSCVTEWCRDESRDERMALCAADRCEMELAGIYMRGAKSCLNCLLSTIGENLQTSAATCVGGSSSRIYGGRNGVMLLSKTPLRNASDMDLPSSGGNRVALFATVDVAGLTRPLEVACTHLSSPVQIPPTQSGYPDWESEQRAQFDMIHERLIARAAGRPAVLVGDLNAGECGNGLSETSPSVWRRAMRLGYRNAVTLAVPPFCTECRENALCAAPNGNGSAIDHVLIADTPSAGMLAPYCAERLFAERTVIRGYHREPVSTNLSDHYGLKVKFNVR